MDKVFDFLAETWRANLESNLHPLTKIILAIFMWALPLATAIEIFKYLTLEGWTTIIFICTTIIFSISTLYLYRNRYLADEKMKSAIIKEKWVDSLQKEIESENKFLNSSIQQYEKSTNQYATKIDELVNEKAILIEKVNKFEQRKQIEKLSIDEQNKAIEENAKRLADERTRTLESDYYQKLSQREKEIEKELKKKYEELKANFEKQYLEDVERSAKEKAKEFINKELPFDI